MNAMPWLLALLSPALSFFPLFLGCNPVSALQGNPFLALFSPLTPGRWGGAGYMASHDPQTSNIDSPGFSEGHSVWFQLLSNFSAQTLLIVLSHHASHPTQSIDYG